ncbi:MAG: ribonuclease III domain-containing protein [Halobacteriota archaeon]
MNDTRVKEIKEFLNTNFSFGPKNIELYNEALTHSGNNVLPNNQRLAFLGDVVLELIIRDHYFRAHPDLDRGLLSKECDRLVNQESFAKIAIKLEIVNCMHIENPPPDFKTNTKINEEVFEALFGAIYLDQDLEKATEIAKKLRII